jgi:hypothetical protein
MGSKSDGPIRPRVPSFERPTSPPSGTFPQPLQNRFSLVAGRFGSLVFEILYQRQGFRDFVRATGIPHDFDWDDPRGRWPTGFAIGRGPLGPWRFSKRRGKQAISDQAPPIHELRDRSLLFQELFKHLCNVVPRNLERGIFMLSGKLPKNPLRQLCWQFRNLTSSVGLEVFLDEFGIRHATPPNENDIRGDRRPRQKIGRSPLRACLARAVAMEHMLSNLRPATSSLHPRELA